MTKQTQSDRNYSDAIANLNEALEVLNRPGEGLGVAWGLQRGQAGWHYVLRARETLESLRDDLVRLELVWQKRHKDKAPLP